MHKKYPAIFLDRDGTIIEDVGTISDPKQIELYPDTVESLKRLMDKFKLFVLTNQAGVSKGEVSLEDVENVNKYLSDVLLKEGVKIEQFYTCPHSVEDQCHCIKPKPFMMEKAAEEYNLVLGSSFMIGDHPHDVKTGSEHGVMGLYVLTGHGQKHLKDLSSWKMVFHRLTDAVNWIDEHPDHEEYFKRELPKAAEIIKEGGVVAFPTETVYGLGADVFNPEAVKKIFEIKGRPTNNPLIAHISNMDKLSLLTDNVPPKAKRLMENFWPGPLTVVLEKKDTVPDIVTAGNPTVAVRMPSSSIALELIELTGTAVAAPSANSFTCTSPTTAQHVIEQLGDKCDKVIDGGACRVGVESTVITFSGKVPMILRHGGLSREDIEEIIGPVEVIEGAKDVNKESPGQMLNHYAPKTSLEIVSSIPDFLKTDEKVGIILPEPTGESFNGPVEILSRNGDLKEMAVNLYAAIRRLDSFGLKLMVTLPFPDEGIGRALNDRLKKAANGQQNKT